MSHKASLFFGLLLSVCSCLAQTVPSPETYLGYPLGAHFTPHYKIVDYFKAVAATNSTDTATVIGWMRQNPVNDFFAQGGKLREDGRMVHDMYLMRIKKPEESRSKWDVYEYLDTIPGDQAFRPMAEGGCPYLKQQ